MRVKEDLVLNKVVDEYVVVAKNPDVFKGILKLNETGAFIFKIMQQDIAADKIIEKITEEYDVSKEKAEVDLNEFINHLDDVGLIIK